MTWLFLLLTIDPGTLLQNYRSDPKRYAKHEIIEVSGKVVQATTTLGWSFITFETGRDKDGDIEESVVCMLGRGKNAEVKRVQKGQTITAVGEFDGHSDHIRLQKCVVK